MTPYERGHRDGERAAPGAGLLAAGLGAVSGAGVMLILCAIF